MNTDFSWSARRSVCMDGRVKPGQIGWVVSRSLCGVT